MGFTADEIALIERMAQGSGLEAAGLFGVMAVESGGQAFARVGERLEPLIRWEGHYFDRMCHHKVRARARALRLSSPRAGAIRNPADQAGRWALYHAAARLDRKAAAMSCSWGVGQVMGAHWKTLGYRDVDELIAEARSGLEGQIRLMLRFIAVNRLDKPLSKRDWRGFARGYNGRAYAKNRYHVRLEAAVLSFEAQARRAGMARQDRLRLPQAEPHHGMPEKQVRLLQASLDGAGHAIRVDGIFGPRTRAALLAFQAERGLVVDGIAGPVTRGALDRVNGWRVLRDWFCDPETLPS